MTLIYDNEAEEVVLGTLFGPGTTKPHVAHCVEVLDETDFNPEHRIIFSAIKHSFLDGEPLDHHLTVVHRLRRMGKLDDVGGSQKLLDLLHHAPSEAGAKHHLHTVKWAARLREWQRLQTSSLGSEVDAERLAHEAHTILTELKGGQVRLPSPLEVEVEEVLSFLDKPHREQTGLSSGLMKFDEVTGGFIPGQYVIVGARTSLGKTSLLVQLSISAARQGARVLFLSLEMPARQVTHRVLAQEASVPVQQFTNPKMLSDDSWKRLTSAQADVPKGIWVSDGAFDIDEVLAKVHRAQAQIGPLNIVVVDYIQLVRGRRSETRTQEVGGVSRALKLLANELKVCVLAASQLSRQHEHDKREPRLSDLRESGQLEHDADVVVLIHRPEPEKNQGDVPKLASLIESELIVAKNRNGRIGRAPVHFHAPYNRFEDTA